MANRKNTFLIKRSNVAGKVPTAGDLQLGELAINTSDVILYASGTTANSILPIGWDRVARTGDTMTGNFNFFGDVAISGSSLPNGYALSVTGDTNFSGDMYVGGNLYYDGNTIIQSGLTASTIYTDYIDFNTAYTGQTLPAGRLQWDDGNGTLVLGLKGGISNMEIGLENMALCFNDEATTLTAGTVVYVSGSQGNRPSIKRAIATSDGYSVTTLGIVSESILPGAEGFVTTFGMVNNLNTIGYSGGTPIWLSPTVYGTFTSVKPKAPQHTVLLGYVVRVHASVGSIFVHISNGWEIDELHDVRLNGRVQGDLLTYSGYNGSNVWVNSKILNGSYTITGDTTVGGTVSATTLLTNGFIANNNGITATTYSNLPIDIRVTGGTYSSGTATFTNNTGGTFTVTGFSTGGGSEFTGGTVTGPTVFTGGLTANTISATTYYNLPTDIYVTGATYSNNTFTYTNNTGGTFNSLFNTMTGLTITGDLTVTAGTQSWFSGNSASDLVRITQTGSGNALVVEDSTNPDTSQFVVDNTGNVGIGTNTPIAKLQISNTATTVNPALYTSDFVILTAEGTAPGFNIISAGDASGNRGVFKATRSRGTLSSPTLPQSGDGTLSLLGAIYDGVTNLSTASIQMEVDGAVTANTAPQRIVFATTTGSSRTERMRITSDGKVGIGTTTPGSQFAVRATAVPSAGESIASFTVSDASASFSIQNAANTDSLFIPSLVGNQTTGVNQTALNLTGYINSADDTGTVPIMTFRSALTSLAPATTRPLYDFRNWATSVMTIAANGNVGIGTTSPSSNLHVNGSTLISGSLTASTVSATTYYNLPTDIFVTGATYNNANTFTYTNNTGGTFNVLFNTLTGLTVNGNTTVSNGLVRIQGNSSNELVRLTQLGSGNALIVEDSTNPDVSPFVINASGDTAIGLLAPLNGDKLTVSGNTTVYGTLIGTTISATTINTTNLNVTGSTQSIFSGSSSSEMVRIIQAGSGDAFVVEDQDNGDASHFVINASGNTAIGLTAPIGNDKLTVSGNTTIYGTLSATTYVGLPNSGVLVVPIATSSVAIGTGSNDYYLNFKIPYNLTISKVDFSVSTAGSDSVRIGIYRGQDLTAVLVGQSAGGTVSTLNSVSIVAEVGQNLTFSAGSWIVIGVAVGGTTTNLYGSACPVNNLIAWSNTTDSSGGFPANPRSKAGTRTSFPSIEITVA